MRFWSPYFPPLNAPTGEKCEWYHDHVFFGLSLCLMQNDRISNHVRFHNSWSGCTSHVNAIRTIKNVNLVIDAGANIGICTLHFLRETNATVIAIEPSPLNLFFLTSTLHRATTRMPQWKHRVVVLPAALGDATTEEKIFVAAANSGNSVLRMQTRDHPTQRMDRSFRVPVMTLDDAMYGWTSCKDCRDVFLKVDVQGYECKLLDGMKQTALSVQSMVIELANGWLKPQNCSTEMALEKIHGLGFRWEDTPRCVYSRFGCDLAVLKAPTGSTKRVVLI